MAQVRDFNSYKKKKNVEAVRRTLTLDEDEKEYEKESDKNENQSTASKETVEASDDLRRKKLIFRSVSILTVIVILSVISYIAWKGKVYTQALVTSTVNTVDAADVSCISLDGYIFQYSHDGMNCINENGIAVWNQTFEMQSPMVETCGDVVAIADYNGRRIYIANKNSLLGTVETNLPIRSFSVSARGTVAAVLDDSSVTWIYLYDLDGSTIATVRTTMGDSGYPLDIALSPDSKLLGVSFLTVEASRSKTNIAFYNFGSVGQDYTDNLVSVYICDDNIVPDIKFFDNKYFYALGTDRIMFFSGDETPQMTDQIELGTEEILAVHNSKDYVAVISAGGGQEGAYCTQIYDKEGKLCFKEYSDIEYGEIAFTKDLIALYDSKSWLVLGIDGEKKFESDFGYSVRSVVPTSVKGRYLLVASDKIETVELR